MYRLGGLFVQTAFFPQVSVEHTEIAERDIRGNHIEAGMFQMLFAYCLKPCRYRGDAEKYARQRNVERGSAWRKRAF